MILIHEPRDGDAERYDMDTLSAVEAGAVERACELPWASVEEQVREGSPTHMLAILWVFRKRSDADLKYADVDVPNWRRSLFVRFSDGEVADLVEEINRTYSKDKDKRTESLDRLRAFAADPDAVDRAAEDRAPKASTRGRKA